MLTLLALSNLFCANQFHIVKPLGNPSYDRLTCYFANPFGNISCANLCYFVKAVGRMAVFSYCPFLSDWTDFMNIKIRCEKINMHAHYWTSIWWQWWVCNDLDNYDHKNWQDSSEKRWKLDSRLLLYSSAQEANRMSSRNRGICLFNCDAVCLPQQLANSNTLKYSAN